MFWSFPGQNLGLENHMASLKEGARECLGDEDETSLLGLASEPV